MTFRYDHFTGSLWPTRHPAYAAVAGSLPAGLSFHTMVDAGNYARTPTSTGSGTARIRATRLARRTADWTFAYTVIPGTPPSFPADITCVLKPQGAPISQITPPTPSWQPYAAGSVTLRSRQTCRTGSAGTFPASANWNTGTNTRRHYSLPSDERSRCDGLDGQLHHRRYLEPRRHSSQPDINVSWPLGQSISQISPPTPSGNPTPGSVTLSHDRPAGRDPLCFRRPNWNADGQTKDGAIVFRATNIAGIGGLDGQLHSRLWYTTATVSQELVQGRDRIQPVVQGSDAGRQALRWLYSVL